MKVLDLNLIRKSTSKFLHTYAIFILLITREHNLPMPFSLIAFPYESSHKETVKANFAHKPMSMSYIEELFIPKRLSSISITSNPLHGNLTITGLTNSN